MISQKLSRGSALTFFGNLLSVGKTHFFTSFSLNTVFFSCLNFGIGLDVGVIGDDWWVSVDWFNRASGFGWDNSAADES